MFVCVYVCVRERGRERMCVRERERKMLMTRHDHPCVRAE